MESNIGIIFSYFQLPWLEQQHHDYLKEIKSRHTETAIVLDVKRGACTSEQPLRPNQRHEMLFSDPEVFEVPRYELVHCGDNFKWSEKLDNLVEDIAGRKEITIYIAPELAKKYCGRHKLVLIPEMPGFSTTEPFAKVVSHNSLEFRLGIIFAEQRRFPIAYGTVDVVLIDPYEGTLLLGQKPAESKWRLIGGFVDPIKDRKPRGAKQHAAYRELGEEVPDGVQLMTPLQYLDSVAVPDARYTGEDCIITDIWYAFAEFHKHLLRGGDDIARVCEFPIDSKLYEFVIPDHHRQLDIIIERFGGNRGDLLDWFSTQPAFRPDEDIPESMADNLKLVKPRDLATALKGG